MNMVNFNQQTDNKIKMNILTSITYLCNDLTFERTWQFAKQNSKH